MAKSKDTKVELLGNVPLFWACSKKELGQIAALADEYEAKAGQVLMKEGRPGGECFVVAEGKATVTLRGKQLNKIGAGDVVGEMSLLDHGPRTATVTADSDMVLFVLDPRSFDAMLDEHPSVARKIMKALAQRLRELEDAPTY